MEPKISNVKIAREVLNLLIIVAIVPTLITR